MGLLGISEAVPDPPQETAGSFVVGFCCEPYEHSLDHARRISEATFAEAILFLLLKSCVSVKML